MGKSLLGKWFKTKNGYYQTNFFFQRIDWFDCHKYLICNSPILDLKFSRKGLYLIVACVNSSISLFKFDNPANEFEEISKSEITILVELFLTNDYLYIDRISMQNEIPISINLMKTDNSAIIGTDIGNFY